MPSLEDLRKREAENLANRCLAMLPPSGFVMTIDDAGAASYENAGMAVREAAEAGNIAWLKARISDLEAGKVVR